MTSPLAPARFPDLPQIAGARFASVAAGLRYQGRPDVMLAVLDAGTIVAGTFTRSTTRSAAVVDCVQKIGLPAEGGAAFLINAGNANAFTGRKGTEAVQTLTAETAEAAGVPASRVFTSSTGVIGEPLDPAPIMDHLPGLVESAEAGGLAEGARAIMTTDTFPKGAAAQVEIDGKTVSIAGIAKGSGMIAPDMATMLVYIFTDAVIDHAVLQGLVATGTDKGFNNIPVDRNTPTSDTLLVAATGASGVDVTGSPQFADALVGVMMDLAHQVVRDGEGATKFVEVLVTGAGTPEAAHKHAMAIANSPLVKTAIAGEDPNWGRIVMAIGKSGAPADRDRLRIWFGSILVAENGWVAPSYREEDAAAYMKQQELVIRVDLGLGDADATAWTCDLTHGYIDINADYRS